MIRARCIQPCTWLNRLWSEGSIYVGNETPPRFFVIIGTDDDTDGGSGGGGSDSCGGDCECGKDAYFARLVSPEITE